MNQRSLTVLLAPLFHPSSTNPRQLLQRHLWINASVALLFGFGSLLAALHFPYTLYLFGTLAFFTPGLNLALSVEQLTERALGLTRLIIAALVLSLILFPTFVYAFAVNQGQLGNEHTLLIAFGLAWIGSIALLCLSFALRRFPLTSIRIPEWSKHRLFWLAVLIYVGSLLVHFILYPYLPEADGYSYVVKIDHLMNSHLLPYVEGRPLFLVVGWSLVQITKIPTYWLFKVGLPLLSTVLLGIFYGLTRTFITEKRLQLVGTLSLLLFPVLMQEVLVSRAQSIFMVASIGIIFFLQSLVQSRHWRDIYWFVLFLGTAIVGLKIHELFAFTTVIVLLGLLSYLLPYLKRFPIESTLIASYAAISSYLTLQSSGLETRFTMIISPFWSAILHPHWRLWFINDYVNIDGTQVGWPHGTWVLFYLYNIGVVLPFVIGALIVQRQLLQRLLRQQWIFVLNLILFLAVAELFPRLGLAYLPDRAWIFVALCLALLLPSLLGLLEQRSPLLNKLRGSLVVVLGLSIILNWGITYAKQGRVTRSEYRAAQFLDQTTPSNAIVITQDGNNPLVTFFAHRIAVSPRPQFFTGNNTSAADYLYAPISTTVQPFSHEQLVQDKSDQQASLHRLLDQLINQSDKSKRDLLFEQITTTRNQLESTLLALNTPVTERPASDSSLHYYVLYSFEKFNSLYGHREWWKNSNAFNPNLQKFDSDAHYHKIYDSDGVIIWQYQGDLVSPS